MYSAWRLAQNRGRWRQLVETVRGSPAMTLIVKQAIRTATVQLLAFYTDAERHNTQTDGRTDGRHNDVNSRSHCAVVVRSTKS